MLWHNMRPWARHSGPWMASLLLLSLVATPIATARASAAPGLAARTGVAPRVAAALLALPAAAVPSPSGLIGKATKALAGVASYQTDLTLTFTNTATAGVNGLDTSSYFPAVHDVITGTGVARTDSISATRVQDDAVAMTRTLVTARVQGGSQCSIVAPNDASPTCGDLWFGYAPFPDLVTADQLLQHVPAASVVLTSTTPITDGAMACDRRQVFERVQDETLTGYIDLDRQSGLPCALSLHIAATDYQEDVTAAWTDYSDPALSIGALTAPIVVGVTRKPRPALSIVEPSSDLRGSVDRLSFRVAGTSRGLAKGTAVLVSLVSSPHPQFSYGQPASLGSCTATVSANGAWACRLTARPFSVVDPSVRIVGRHYLLATAGTGYGALSGDSLTPAVMARARATITTELPRGTVMSPDAYNPANNLLRVGTLVPDFRAATLAGRRYRLSAQRGHVVVLKFFAMWCSICRQEAPELERLQRTGTPDAHHPRVLAVLGDPYAGTSDSWSSPHPLATAADVATFARTFGITYPLLVQRNLSASNEYGGPPAIYVIDRQGIIRFASTNMVSYAQLAKAVESAALAS